MKLTYEFKVESQTYSTYFSNWELPDLFYFSRDNLNNYFLNLKYHNSNSENRKVIVLTNGLKIENSFIYVKINDLQLLDSNSATLNFSQYFNIFDKFQVKYANYKLNFKFHKEEELKEIFKIIEKY